MKTIHKYVLTPPFRVRAPAGAKVLVSGEQQGALCVWMEVDTDRVLVDKQFTVVGTGHTAPDDGTYVGTGMMDDGMFVLHVYEDSALPGEKS